MPSPPRAGHTPTTAAFFDLDRTVIAKSGASAFNKPFLDQGLLTRRAVLTSSYAQFLLLMSGADQDQMDRMRSYLTSMCAGWDVDQVGDRRRDIATSSTTGVLRGGRTHHRPPTVRARRGGGVGLRGRRLWPRSLGPSGRHAMGTRMVVKEGKSTPGPSSSTAPGGQGRRGAGTGGPGGYPWNTATPT